MRDMGGTGMEDGDLRNRGRGLWEQLQIMTAPWRMQMICKICKRLVISCGSTLGSFEQ